MNKKNNFDNKIVKEKYFGYKNIITKIIFN